MSNKKVKHQETATQNEKENEVQILKQKIEEDKEKFLRVLADYENKMKRVQIDAQNATISAISNLVKDLVPILEDLHQASKIAPAETKDGLTLISKNAKKTLTKYGIEEITPEIGADFNPEEHQAISSKESDFEEGKIVEILKTGYKYGNRTIVPAVVITSI